MEMKKLIEIKVNYNEEFDKIISENLHTYNRSKCEWIRENMEIKPPKRQYYNFGVYENNELVGGAVGIIRFGWYFLEELWLNENYRGKKIGTKLIQKIEECAKENNVIGIRMETWSFQARGFYEKMGYTVWAEIKDCPPGTIDYFLKKELKKKN